MDADVVREVEFSRKLRGYDMGQVDAFLEEIEAMLRRRNLEQENMQHKLEELSGARDAQSEKLSILNGQVLLTQEENEKLLGRINELTQTLAQRDAKIQELEQSLADMTQKLEAAEKVPEALPAEPKAVPQAAEAVPAVVPDDKQEKESSREELQKRFVDATTAAKDSLKQLSQSLKVLYKK